MIFTIHNHKQQQVVAAALLLLATQLPESVDAHGYLKSPRSRNYHASINPIWSGGKATDPAPENCPHCLNIGGTEARCGKVGESIHCSCRCILWCPKSETHLIIIII